MHASLVEGKRVTIIGAKRSGIASALLLQEKGATVFVSDSAPVGEPERNLLDRRGIAYEQSVHSGKVLDADFCIVSPGIPSGVPVIRSIEKEGIPLFSEIETASWFCSARIIGVTGTDGKTTTATLIAAICDADASARGHRVFKAGNIGVPFSSVVGEMRTGDIAVVELSSYQLERCDTFRPDVAVITNIMPDHLDRYEGSMQRYAEAKYRIYANQGSSDSLVYNLDNKMLREHFSDRKNISSKLVPFSLDSRLAAAAGCDYATADGEWLAMVTGGEKRNIIRTADLVNRCFRGRHNLENALAAIAAASVAGVAKESIRQALAQFGGVEHRQEYVGTIREIDWINDSKSTNLNALSKAIEATPGKLVLIAGGREKGGDFSRLHDQVREKVDMLVVFGESQEKFAVELSPFVRVVHAASLDDAVKQALRYAMPGQTVLFSPGCSSFDMFENFEERGMKFKQKIREIAE